MSQRCRERNRRPDQKVVRAFVAMATVSTTVFLTIPAVFAATGSGNSTTSQAPPLQNAASQAATAVAKHEPSLVALGDSITFGYNLSDTDNNTLPSAFAFPALISKADNLKLSNLGTPGWTSADLLNALSSPNFQQAIAGANVVVLDIGSNDLLGPAAQMGLLSQGEANPSGNITVTPEEQKAFATAVTNFGTNLTEIVGGIRKLTTAPVLLYNLYNPFPASTGLGGVTAQLETPMNNIIAQVGAAVPNVYFVNANQAFANNQLTYVRIAEHDVHPTPTGQGVLAQAGEQALQPALAAVEKSATGMTAGVTSLAVQAVPASGGVVKADFGATSIELSIPTGVLNQSSEVDVTSDLTDMSKLAPKNTTVLATFAVNFMAGVQLAGPYQATVSNQNIPASAAVYQVSAGKLTPVPGAIVTKGRVAFATTEAGEFIVLAPVQKVVPNATKPVTGVPVRGEGMLAGGLVALGSLLLWRNRRQGTKTK